MRLWEKNYYYTIAIFVVLLFVCIFVILHITFATALSSAKETAINDEYHIAKAISGEIAALEKRNVVSDIVLRNITAPYGDHYNRNGVAISLYSPQSVYYSSFGPGDDIAKDYRNAMVCRIVSLNRQKTVLVTDKLQGTTGSYWLAYAVDVEEIYAAHAGRMVFMFSLGAAASLLLAVLAYIAIRRVFRPISSLAHELRTPLTAIGGYAQYLLMAAANEQQRHTAAQYIVSESQRLTDITDKLLIMGGLRDGDIPRENVDIEAVFKNIKTTFPSVEYTVQQKYFKGNRSLIQSLISNLVSNAVKAGEPGQPIALRAFSNTIEVSDSGKGMPEAFAAQLSKPQPRYPSQNGSGLGVALCHQIAQWHQATLKYESEPAKGTTARITFTKR